MQVQLFRSTPFYSIPFHVLNCAIKLIDLSRNTFIFSPLFANLFICACVRYINVSDNDVTYFENCIPSYEDKVLASV